jgi:hypothetical protein
VEKLRLTRVLIIVRIDGSQSFPSLPPTTRIITPSAPSRRAIGHGTIKLPQQEVSLHRRFAIIASLLIFLALSIGCSTKPLSSDESSDTSTPPKPSSWFGEKKMTLPEGTVITVRLANAVGSKLSNSGDEFHASVATPVEADGKVVVPSGAEAAGKVLQAVPLGRFKGGAVLKLALDSVTINGDAYDVKTGSVSRYLKGKGKRTAAMIGGGAGGGALIGGLAGGGKGALIGAALGAGAGTAGAAYTGNKEIILPAESTLSFKLTEPLTVKM